MPYESDSRADQPRDNPHPYAGRPSVSLLNSAERLRISTAARYRGVIPHRVERIGRIDDGQSHNHQPPHKLACFNQTRPPSLRNMTQVTAHGIALR